MLFSPFMLRGKTLPTRAVFTAHTVSLGSDGVPGERALAYYGARAAGGAGMIVMEPVPVLDNGGSHATELPVRGSRVRFGSGTGRGRRASARVGIHLPALSHGSERRPPLTLV